MGQHDMGGHRDSPGAHSLRELFKLDISVVMCVTEPLLADRSYCFLDHKYGGAAYDAFRGDRKFDVVYGGYYTYRNNDSSSSGQLL